MASLRKFPRSPFWFACFTDPTGKRRQCSTKEKSRKAAQALADEWERMAKEKSKARQAHKVIGQIYRAAHREALPESTPRTFLTKWIERRTSELAPASVRAYSSRITHFIGFLGAAADGPLGDLERRHFLEYRDSIAARLSPATANQAVKLLRVPLEEARREGFVAENPAKDCPALKATRGTTRRPFTVDELRRVLATAEGEWRSMIIFGLYTGQRLGDIASLTWANVDTAANEIALRTRKTGRLVRIPICQPLADHIATLPVGDGAKAPIHPRCAQFTNGSTLSRQFAELLAAAGLATFRSHAARGSGRDGKRSPAADGLSFHCLRHTATSMMKNAGISPAIVQDIIGHDSAEMSAHYTHVESSAKRKAMETLPNILTQ